MRSGKLWVAASCALDARGCVQALHLLGHLKEIGVVLVIIVLWHCLAGAGVKKRIKKFE